jgi:bifunctional non-homologous end joining protein LigD
VLRKSSFIEPALPVLKPRLPKGDGWLYEIKFDGYRVQLHLRDGQATILSKNGADFTNRFPRIAAALADLPVKSAIIDGEVVACGTDGAPDFRALHGGNYSQTDLCVWCFDLLEVNGDDIRQIPLLLRRVKLGKLLRAYDHDALRYSEAFNNAEKLLEECAKRGLEGIVCKEKGVGYWSGTKCGWIKVKSAQWREANKDRGEMFNQKTSKTIPTSRTSTTGTARAEKPAVQGHGPRKNEQLPCRVRRRVRDDHQSQRDQEGRHPAQLDRQVAGCHQGWHPAI